MHMAMMQLSTLWYHYDTNIWVDLYPLEDTEKKDALTGLSFRLLALMAVFEAVILFFRFNCNARTPCPHTRYRL